MSFVASQNPLSNVRVLQATTWNVAKVNATTAGTIYSYTFPNNTKKFALLADKARNLRIGPSAAAITAGDYWEVYQGVEFTVEQVTLDSFTIYFTSDQANDIIRFQSWS